MAGMESKALGRTLYRVLLRWGKGAGEVPISVRYADLYDLCPHLKDAQHWSKAGLHVQHLTRTAFRQNLDLMSAERGDALDLGLEAVKRLHNEYNPQLQRLKEFQSDRSDRSGIRYSVGTVFRHKKHGYRGIVYGWDRVCERDAHWAKEMEVHREQPFYSVLPDELDCMRAFGALRMSKYVAESNMEVIFDPPRISHRALLDHFVGFSRKLGRYIPNEKLQFEYPDSYNADDVEPVAKDANMLLHDDPLPRKLPSVLMSDTKR